MALAISQGPGKMRLQPLSLKVKRAAAEAELIWINCGMAEAIP
jgi:hypothetical protein